MLQSVLFLLQLLKKKENIFNFLLFKIHRECPPEFLPMKTLPSKSSSHLLTLLQLKLLFFFWEGTVCVSDSLSLSLSLSLSHTHTHTHTYTHTYTYTHTHTHTHTNTHTHTHKHTNTNTHTLIVDLLQSLLCYYYIYSMFSLMCD